MPPHPFKLLTLAIELGLVPSNLLILLLASDLLALELISDEGTRSQSERATNECTCSRTANGATNDTSCSSPSKCSYPRCLLPCC